MNRNWIVRREPLFSPVTWRIILGLILVSLLCAPAKAANSKSKKAAARSDVKSSSNWEALLNETRAHAEGSVASAGSTYDPSSHLADLSRDLRAALVNDLLTVVVADHASASSSGTTATQRKSQLNASVTALGGLTKATGPLTNLAGTSGNNQLNSQGATNRTTDLTTTLTARVIAVMPGGNLLVEGNKFVQINAERQKVTVRGVVRPADITPSNTISSDRLGELEVMIDGRGVVNDAIRRPNFLYRMLMGILPI